MIMYIFKYESIDLKKTQLCLYIRIVNFHIGA